MSCSARRGIASSVVLFALLAGAPVIAEENSHKVERSFPDHSLWRSDATAELYEG